MVEKNLHPSIAKNNYEKSFHSKQDVFKSFVTIEKLLNKTHRDIENLDVLEIYNLIVEDKKNVIWDSKNPKVIITLLEEIYRNGDNSELEKEIQKRNFSIIDFSMLDFDRELRRRLVNLFARIFKDINTEETPTLNELAFELFKNTDSFNSFSNCIQFEKGYVYKIVNWLKDYENSLPYVKERVIGKFESGGDATVSGKEFPSYEGLQSFINKWRFIAGQINLPKEHQIYIASNNNDYIFEKILEMFENGFVKEELAKNPNLTSKAFDILKKIALSEDAHQSIRGRLLDALCKHPNLADQLTEFEKTPNLPFPLRWGNQQDFLRKAKFVEKPTNEDKK